MARTLNGNLQGRAARIDWQDRLTTTPAQRIDAALLIISKHMTQEQYNKWWQEAPDQNMAFIDALENLARDLKNDPRTPAEREMDELAADWQATYRSLLP